MLPNALRQLLYSWPAEYSTTAGPVAYLAFPGICISSSARVCTPPEWLPQARVSEQPPPTRNVVPHQSAQHRGQTRPPLHRSQSKSESPLGNSRLPLHSSRTVRSPANTRIHAGQYPHLALNYSETRWYPHNNFTRQCR